MAKQEEASLLLRIKTTGEETLDKVKGAFSAMAAGAAAAFGTVSAFVVKSIAEYREQEAATNALTQAMVNNGVYSKALAQDYKKQAEAISDLTTFSGDQIVSAQAALQQQIGSIKVTKELTTAIADFATAQKMDLASAAEVVGKSIGTSNNALARYGVEVDKNASSQERMSQVMAGLNMKFGGQAAAATQGLGALAQLKNKIDDVFEAFGERLAPAIGVIGNIISQFIDRVFRGSAAIEGFTSIVKGMVWIAIQAANQIEGMGQVIGVGLAAAVEAASQAMRGNFKQAVGTVGLAYDELKRLHTEGKQRVNDQLQKLDEAFAVQQEGNRQQEMQRLETSLNNQQTLKLMKAQEAQNTKMEQQFAFREMEIAMLYADEEQKLQIEAQYIQQKLQNATDATMKRALLEQQARNQDAREHALFLKQKTEAEKKADQERVQARTQTLSTISTLQNSSNQSLAAIGKAAALTQIAIDTPVAVGRALAAFPPPFNYAAAAAVGAAMAAQAARVAGIPLAEGGIVRATPGGVPAIIGEGGRDEAVIPLDKAGGIGGNVTIVVNGGLLGDASSAREFARAVDQELLKLRQNNESVAFDSGVV